MKLTKVRITDARKPRGEVIEHEVSSYLMAGFIVGQYIQHNLRPEFNMRTRVVDDVMTVILVPTEVKVHPAHPSRTEP